MRNIQMAKGAHTVVNRCAKVKPGETVLIQGIIDAFFYEKNEKGEPTDLPEDRVVTENPRNGFLTIKKKK